MDTGYALIYTGLNPPAPPVLSLARRATPGERLTTPTPHHSFQYLNSESSLVCCHDDGSRGHRGGGAHCPHQHRRCCCSWRYVWVCRHSTHLVIVDGGSKCVGYMSSAASEKEFVLMPQGCCVVYNFTCVHEGRPRSDSRYAMCTCRKPYQKKSAVGL